MELVGGGPEPTGGLEAGEAFRRQTAVLSRAHRTERRSIDRARGVAGGNHFSSQRTRGWRRRPTGGTNDPASDE